MGIPSRRGVGPDFDHGPLRPDAGQGERRRDVHVRGEAPRRVECGAHEDAGRGGDGSDVNTVLLEIWRPGQAAGGLPGFDGDAIDVALGRGADGIEA